MTVKQCSWGHDMTPSPENPNYRVTPDGRKRCRACDARRERDRYAARKRARENQSEGVSV